MMSFSLANPPQALQRQTDILVLTIGQDLALDTAQETLLKELAQPLPKKPFSPVVSPYVATTTVFVPSLSLSSHINSLSVKSLSIDSHAVSRALSRFSPQILIIIGHGTPTGMIDPKTGQQISWQTLAESLQGYNIPSINIAACYSSQLTQYLPIDISFEGVVDARLASLFIATSIFYSVYGDSSPLTQNSLQKMISTGNKILNGKLQILPLAPIQGKITTWWEWITPHLKITITYNTMYLLTSFVLGLSVFTYSIVKGGMSPWGFVYELIGFILKLIDFGWWWSAIVVPVLQITLTALLLYYLAPMAQASFSAITTLGYTLESIALEFLMAYTAAKFFVTLFKTLAKILLEPLGLYNSYTKAFLNTFGYKAEGKIRSYIYKQWTFGNREFANAMSQVFRGIPWWLKGLLYDVAMPLLDELIWTQNWFSNFTSSWVMQVF